MNNLKQLLTLVELAVSDLNELLQSSSIIQSAVFNVPSPLKENENIIIEQRLAPTEVFVYEGEQAIVEASNAYLRFFATPFRSTRIVDKSPGFLVVSNNHNKINDCLVEIAHRKQTFKNAVLAIPRGKRFDFVHEILPYAITSNIYRSINSATNIERIYFNWARKYRSDVISYEKAKAIVQSKYSGELGADTLKQVFDKLSLFENQELRIRRQINVRPDQTYYSNGKLTKSSQSSTPIILLQSNVVKFTPLTPPKISMSLPSRAPVGYELIDKRTYLYAKKNDD